MMVSFYHLLLLYLSLPLSHTQGLNSEPTCTNGGILDVAYSNQDDEECVDQLPRCAIWAHQHNYCVLNPSFMEEYCPSSCRLCRRVNLSGPSGEDDRERKSKEVMQRILETMEQHAQRRRNLQSNHHHLPSNIERSHSCEGMLEKCATVKNQKSTSTTFMNQYCTAACESCRAQHHFNLTCPLEEPATYQAGDVGRVFTNITATTTTINETMQIISNDPWLVVIDDFLSDAECDALVLCGTNAGLTRTSNYHRSRRSSTALCEIEDGVIADLYSRVEELVHVPHVNTEPIQIAKYNPGQFHRMHHDYDGQGRGGHRALTVLLYLNTVQQGGGTHFPEVGNTTIVARKGRAVLWSNGFDSGSALWRKDKRLVHEDLPVLKGLKYVANIWIHPRRFRTGTTWEDADLAPRHDEDLQYSFS